MGSSEQNIWWQEDLHAACSGYYEICILHKSSFLDEVSHDREKCNKINLVSLPF